MDAVAEQCTGFPNFQSAYRYPFKESADDIQIELDGLIGWYSEATDTGQGLRYIYAKAQQYNAAPICHLSAFQQRYTDATSMLGTPGAVRDRFPTKGELNVESYLSLAYGMRGIGYYLYQSQFIEPDLQTSYVGLNGEYYANMIGIFHRDGDGQSFEKTGMCVGGFYENGFNQTQYQYTPADALQEFFADLDLITPCLNNLNWQYGGCFSESGGPSLQNIIDIDWIEPFGEHLVEVCEFEGYTGTAIPQGDYFMVVNRDVNDTEGIYIITNKNQSNYIIEDMHSHALKPDAEQSSAYLH